MKELSKTAQKELSKVMSLLGKKSAEKRKEMGHDSDYYSKMIKKRWANHKPKKRVHRKEKKS